MILHSVEMHFLPAFQTGGAFGCSSVFRILCKLHSAKDASEPLLPGLHFSESVKHIGSTFRALKTYNLLGFHRLRLSYHCYNLVKILLHFC